MLAAASACNDGDVRASTLPGIFISGSRHDELCPHISSVSDRDGYLRVYLDITPPRICLDIHTYLVFRRVRCNTHLSNVLLTSKGNLPSCLRNI